MKELLTIVFLFIAFSSYAQKIKPAHFYTTWQLDKYSDEEEYYYPPKKEMGDYLSLRTDMTYKSVTEGDINEGTWIFNTNGQYIELKNKDGSKEKFYVHFLSNKSMVVTYDTDEYRVWEVHYISSK